MFWCYEHTAKLYQEVCSCLGERLLDKVQEILQFEPILPSRSRACGSLKPRRWGRTWSSLHYSRTGIKFCQYGKSCNKCSTWWWPDNPGVDVEPGARSLAPGEFALVKISINIITEIEAQQYWNIFGAQKLAFKNNPTLMEIKNRWFGLYKIR